MRVRLAAITVLATASCASPPEPNAVNQTALVTGNAAGAASGLQVAPQMQPEGEVRFLSVLALNQRPAAGQPQLRGGTVADSNEWQASLYTTFETPRGLSSCTAALVGPQAVLTAGHCVPASGRISINFGNRDYPAACEAHPGYARRTDVSADFALCKTETPLSLPAGFRFETINQAPMDRLSGQRLVLGGYGCISDAVADEQTDGLYRIGYNQVDETSNSRTRRRGPEYYAAAQKNNLFTRDDPALANLCPGDSGGPAFVANPASEGPHASRTIVGVNSRVFYRDYTQRAYSSSLVSATGGPDFGSWAAAWRNRNQVAVCGLGGGLPNCRS